MLSWDFLIQELLDHKNVSLRLVRQLTPFPKVQTEVITLEPWGTITDTRGNRVQDFEKDKKHVSFSFTDFLG